MADSSASSKQRHSNKYHRARIRHFLFTVGPDRLSGGRIRRRHLAQNLEVREIEIASPNWPKGFDGLRIGHVSDFHLGELLPLNRALAVIDQLGALEPDLVACTGDVVDLHHHEAAPLLQAMADIPAPLGSTLVLGNHDELHCPDTITRLAREVGVNVLRNEAMEVVRNGQRLTIAGIHWAKSAVDCADNIDRTCGEGGCDLLLSHNPKAFLHAAGLGIPLTLAGHTHGGQIAMKNRPDTCLAPTHRHRVGLYSTGPSRLYVTTGVGAWFPLRINCPAEIAIITMRHDANGAAQQQASTADDAVKSRTHNRERFRLRRRRRK